MVVLKLKNMENPKSLNQRIAEVKGMCRHEFPDAIFVNEIPFINHWELPKCIKCGYKPIDDKHTCIPKSKFNPDWEHKIADAFTLLMEMDRPEMYNTLMNLAIEIYTIKNPDPTEESVCRTICEAYLAWKEYSGK